MALATEQPEQPEHQKKARFLTAFRDCGNIRAAAEQARVGRTTVYYWQEHDADFLAAFHQAEAEATEQLEQEAHRRAVRGVRRLKFDRNGDAVIDPETGQPYVELDYSDTLLIFLLKARAPEKYRERFDVTRSDQPMVKAYAAEDLALL